MSLSQIVVSIIVHCAYVFFAANHFLSISLSIYIFIFHACSICCLKFSCCYDHCSLLSKQNVLLLFYNIDLNPFQHETNNLFTHFLLSCIQFFVFLFDVVVFDFCTFFFPQMFHEYVRKLLHSFTIQCNVAFIVFVWFFSSFVIFFWVKKDQNRLKRVHCIMFAVENLGKKGDNFVRISIVSFVLLDPKSTFLIMRIISVCSFWIWPNNVDKNIQQLKKITRCAKQKLCVDWIVFYYRQRFQFAFSLVKLRWLFASCHENCHKTDSLNSVNNFYFTFISFHYFDS